MLRFCLQYINKIIEKIKMKTKRSKQKGFTLIELMIAITIGTILTAGIVQLMRITRQSYLLSTHLGDLLGNADAAITTLSRCATQAGHQSGYYTEDASWNFNPTKLYFGCFNDNTTSNPTNRAFAQLIQSVNVGTASNLTNCAIAAANLGYNSVGFMPFGSASYSGKQYLCWAGNNGGPFRWGPTTTSWGCWNQDSNDIYLLRGSGTVYSGAPFSGTYGGTTANANDTLVISFEGQSNGVPPSPPTPGVVTSGVTTDCLGRIVAPNVLVINTFAIQNDTLGNPYLACSVTSLNVSTGANLGNTGFQPIAYGVQGLRVLYGIDTDADGAPNKFVNASFFNTDAGSFTDIFGNIASNSSARIVGVQVALLMRTNQPISAIQDTKTYTLLNNAAIGPLNDNYIRKLYTISLKTNECVPTLRKDCGPGVEFYGWFPSYYNGVNNPTGTAGFSGYIRPGTTAGPNASTVIWSPPITIAGTYPSYCGCQLDSAGGLRAWWNVGGTPGSNAQGGTSPVFFYQTHNPQNQLQSTTKASCANGCCCAFR